MTTPILLQHIAFDKTLETTFPFSSIGGNQVVKNRLQVLDNVTLAVIYDATQITYSLYHTLPPNSLVNGTYYIARVKTYDVANVESDWSSDIQFYCFANPTVAFQGLSPTIHTSNQIFNVLYSQAQSEPIASYQFNLYNSSLELLQQSSIMYNTANVLPPMTLSHMFEGLLDGRTYYVECLGTTLHGMDVNTGRSSFIVQYTEPDIFSTIDIVSDCENGVNTITSNIIAIEGISTPTAPIYINNTELDNRDDRVTVTWDEGFAINEVMTVEMWGRQFNPSTEIMRTFGDNANEKIVLKYMNNILDPSPTVGEFDALNITAGTFDSKNFTPIKFKYKFYQTLGTQTYNEYVQMTYTSPLGVDTVVNSNQIPQTLDNDQVVIFVRYNGTTWTVTIENKGVV
jgi:hypothetical protein